MRAIAALFLAFLCLSVLTQAVSAQQLAVPMDVKTIVNAPPKVGYLLRASGYLETNGRDIVLRDAVTGHKVVLDFSNSTVSPESLGGNGALMPVEVTGRMLNASSKDRPVIGVIGVMTLTP